MTEHAVLVSPKIFAVHLGRDAYVYVRQSTLTQVREHADVLRLVRQYELRERADAGEKGCQSLGGRRLEKHVLYELFKVLAPAALAATAQALGEAEQIHANSLRVFSLTVERARFEADRARRQYDAVEPENRLVARTLERALDAKLALQRRTKRDLLAQQTRRPVKLSELMSGPSSKPPPHRSGSASNGSVRCLLRSSSPSTPKPGRRRRARGPPTVVPGCWLPYR